MPHSINYTVTTTYSGVPFLWNLEPLAPNVVKNVQIWTAMVIHCCQLCLDSVHYAPIVVSYIVYGSGMI